MKEPVLLKGNSFGLTMTLDDTCTFNELLNFIGEKFQQAAGFFNSKKQIALKIEGRVLTSDEIEQVIDVISKNSSLMIGYVIEENEVIETQFQKVLEQERKEKEAREKATTKKIENEGQFYKGTLRSGQMLESDASVVVIGDVNPGATVQAVGNIVVLGCIKGNVFAGANGNENAFIAALDMAPIQIRIGNKIARSSDSIEKKKRRFRKKKKEIGAEEVKIAFVEEENIYIEPISKALLSEITI